MFRHYLNIILGFLCYFAALFIQINRFQFEEKALNASIFRVFVNFK